MIIKILNNVPKLVVAKSLIHKERMLSFGYKRIISTIERIVKEISVARIMSINNEIK
ncbi:MAG: hypothetical protein GF353_08250 [Candidatus Lokiarchaeota archaeon]|nr:hypothetical protein [Candidatus Lokiarchaeota archaeon]